MEKRASGAAEGGEGFKRRMTSVGRPVGRGPRGRARGARRGNRATLARRSILRHHASPSPPPISPASVAREQNLTLRARVRHGRERVESLGPSRRPPKAGERRLRSHRRRSPWTWTGPNFNPFSRKSPFATKWKNMHRAAKNIRSTRATSFHYFMQNLFAMRVANVEY